MATYMEKTRHKAKIPRLKELEKTGDEGNLPGPEVKMESFR
jgi:hypothetical protein